jgi:hypothetical protein
MGDDAVSTPANAECILAKNALTSKAEWPELLCCCNGNTLI